MDETPNLALPYIMPAQAQKHVTHNEAIRSLDAMVQLSVKNRDLTAPPGSPAHGDRHIPASGSTGEWMAKDGQIAAYQDNAWLFHQPREGWRCWVADENILLVHDGSAWNNLLSGAGGLSFELNRSSFDATTRIELREEELTLSGASADSTIVIPDRAIVFAVTTRTTEAITGAVSYDCGIASEAGKYGSSLGVAANSVNSGVTGPTAYYADTPIRITANGGNFAGGAVRITVHYMLFAAPTS